MRKETQIIELLDLWRNLSPMDWAQSKYGWFTEAGKPITLADWQRAVLSAYAARKDDISTLFISAPKKSGKTLLNSLILCHRWLTQPGVHFALGNDFDQGAMLQSDMIAEMCKRHPLLKRYIHPTAKELVFKPTNSRLITLPADYSGSAGHNFLTVSFTEIWAFLAEGHTRLYEELTPPPLVGALRIVDSYAGFTAESELLERVWARGIEGERINDNWPIYLAGQQLSYIHQGIDAQQSCWRGSESERIAYYAEQRQTLRENTYARLHLNQWVSGEGNFVSLDAWQACINEYHKPLPPYSRERVIIGLDLAVGAKGDDCALAGVYGQDSFVKLALHKVWAGKQRKTQLKLSETVLPYLISLKEKYHIQAVCYDPWQAVLLGEMLRAAGLRAIPVTQSHSSRGPKDTFLYDAVMARELVLYDHPDVKNLASQAQAKELPDGRIFLKKASGRSKIDLLIALSNCADEAKKPRGVFVG